MAWKVVGDPGNPQQLAAATSQGVFFSRDGGKTWSLSDLHQFTWTLAYGGTGQQLYAGTSKRGVFRSQDGGRTWRREDLGLGNLDVRAIATSASAIVLGTQAGIYISGDGESWQAAGLSSMSISAVAIVAQNPLGVVAGSDQTAQRANLFRSLSVAVSPGWQELPQGDPGGAPVFAVATGPLAQGASSPPLLVGSLKGLYSSADGGNTWQADTLAGTPLWSVDTIAFDPENPNVIYVGGDNGGSSGGGIQRSQDGGHSWAAFQGGLQSRSQDVTGLAVLPTSPPTVLAATWNPGLEQGGLVRALDSAAPPPVALSSSSGTPISVVPTATPRPAGHPHRHPVAQGRPLRIPVWLVVVVVLAIVLLLILGSVAAHRRRLRLDAEAPP